MPRLPPRPLLRCDLLASTNLVPVVFTLEDLRRVVIEEVQLERLAEMRETLRGIDSQALSDESLEALGIVLGQPLDVDSESLNPCDAGATPFFRACVGGDLVRDLDDGFHYYGRWRNCYTGKYEAAEWTLPKQKAVWFTDGLTELCQLDPTIWDPWNIDPFSVYEGTGLTLPMYMFTTHHGYCIVRQYQSEWAFFPVDETKPHVATLVFDSCDAPAAGRVLRSDVDYAIELIKFRLVHGRHTDHHTKPVMIYTIERESHARITQAYLDSTTNQLVLRQSRQLDIAGPEPTDDAFAFVRWMATIPAGDTAYVDEEDSEEEDAAATEPPDMAPRLLLMGCA